MRTTTTTIPSPRFIRLTSNGKPFFLNAAVIAGFTRPDEKSTRVFCIGDGLNDFWSADETPEEIIRLVGVTAAATEEA